MTLVTAKLAIVFLVAGAAQGTAREGAREVRVRGAAFQLVRIPAGEFVMGSDAGNPSERPLHRVGVSAFDMAATEVTVKQFGVFVEATGYRTDAEREGWAWMRVPGGRGKRAWTIGRAGWRHPGFPQSGNDPAVCISWQDAVAFCEWLSKESGQRFRLPSEAEWEYASRAGVPGQFAGELAEVAWYEENSGNRTHPVAGKRPDAWGLYDMHGNAWEWCGDMWHRNYEGAPADARPWVEGGDHWVLLSSERDWRVLRGGAWGLGPSDGYRNALRSAARPPFPSSSRCNNSGFRLASSQEATAAPVYPRTTSVVPRVILVTLYGTFGVYAWKVRRRRQAPAGRLPVRLIVRSAAVSATLIAWWVLLYTDRGGAWLFKGSGFQLGMLFPEFCGWLTGAVSLWGAALIVAGAIQYARRDQH